MRSGMRRRQSRQNDALSQKGHQSRARIDALALAGAGLWRRLDRRSADESLIFRSSTNEYPNLDGGVYKPHRVIHRLWTRCGYYANDILRIYLLFIPI